MIESDLGCTSRVYFDNVTLSRHRNDANTIKSVNAAKQRVINITINEVNVFSIIYGYSDILLKKQNLHLFC